MILNVYAMRDKHTGFLAPTFEVNDHVAIRAFSYALLNSPGSVLGFAPADFDLFYLGTYDTDSGYITSLAVPSLVVTGQSAFNYSVVKDKEVS